MRFGVDYDKALQNQRIIESTLANPCKPLEVSQLVRAWIEIVAYKRELRFIPRMRAADARELLRDAKPHARRTLDVAASPDTVEPKESLNSQTVTAPPTPEPPSDTG